MIASSTIHTILTLVYVHNTCHEARVGTVHVLLGIGQGWVPFVLCYAEQRSGERAGTVSRPRGIGQERVGFVKGG